MSLDNFCGFCQSVCFIGISYFIVQYCVHLWSRYSKTTTSWQMMMMMMMMMVMMIMMRTLISESKSVDLYSEFTMSHFKNINCLVTTVIMYDLILHRISQFWAYIWNLPWHPDPYITWIFGQMCFFFFAVACLNHVYAACYFYRWKEAMFLPVSTVCFLFVFC